MDANWPATVAMAAPVTPMAGMGPSPSTKTRSKMMLETAPVNCIIMATMVRPWAVMIRSMPTERKMPTERDRQMVMYSRPKSRTMGSLSCQFMKGRERNRPIEVKTRELRIMSTRPLPAARLASPIRCSPSRREIREFMPTAVPTATEIMSICRGFTVERAFRALSPMVLSVPGT